MSLLPTGAGSAKQQSGFLVQTGGTITGSLMFLDSPCSGIGDVSGTVNGTSVSLAVNPTGVQIALTGTLGSNQQTMGGDFTILQAGCSGTSSAPLAGTWTADLVKALNGNITGTFVSKENVAYPITGQITQGPNTGVSTAALSGSLNVTGYCFASANIVGTVSGTALVISLVNADGSQAGQINAISSLDGTQVSGSYSILAQGSTGMAPCKGGDGGTVTFNL